MKNSRFGTGSFTLPVSHGGFATAPKGVRKLLMIMKLTVVLLTVVCLQVAAKTSAQQVNLSADKITLQQIFDAVKAQTGYNVVANKNFIQQAPAISVDFKGASISTVMEKCSSFYPFDYEIINKNILVTRKGIPEPVISKKRINIKWTLKNKKGEPVVGATVMVKGTTNVTTSDELGQFSLEGIDDDAILIITSVTYQNVQVAVNGKVSNILAMDIKNTDLKEVEVTVSTGYWSTSQKLSTGNIGVVSGDELRKQPIANPLQGLEGRVPGVVVTQTSGVPGSQIKLQVRGLTSIGASLNNLDGFKTTNDPLIVIDGVPFAQNNNSQNNSKLSSTVFGNDGASPLSLINPNDISKIEILKDADATAIYGSRGANGVILITTRKGKVGKTAFDLNVYTGVNQTRSGLKFLSTKDFMKFRRAAFAADGIIPTGNPGPTFAPDLFRFDSTKNTNYSDYFLGNSSTSQNAQGTLSGGSGNTQFLIAVGYNQSKSLFPGDDLKYKRGSANFNIGHSTTDKKLNIQLSGFYSTEDNKLTGQDPTSFIRLAPNFPDFYDSTGNIVWNTRGISFDNPKATLLKKLSNKANTLSSNLAISYSPIPELTVRTSFGYNVLNNEQKYLSPKSSIAPTSSTPNSAQFSTLQTGNWVIEPQIDFHKSIPLGDFSFLVGSTFLNLTSKSTFIRGNNFIDDALLEYIGAAGVNSISGSNSYLNYRYNSLYGRFNYTFKQKYILNLTGRRDGSSRFGPRNRFANFGAVGVAYIITEDILKDKKWLSFAKIRASYGTTGNDKIGDYNYLNTWSVGTNYQGSGTLYPTSLFNADYAWEVNKKFEASIDLKFNSDKQSIATTFYRNRSSNQLISYQLPNQTGFNTVIANFPAIVENSGWEFEASSTNIRSKNFTWFTSFNISIPKNKLVAFPGIEKTPYNTNFQVGQSLQVLKGLKYLGVNPNTGLYEFEDVDKSQSINASDYQVLGNLDPRFFGGLNNTLSYKNFSLSFFIAFKKQIGLNYRQYISAPGLGYANVPVDILNNYWEKPGDIKEFQKLTTTASSKAYTVSEILRTTQNDAKYSDASYIRLKNIYFSYQLEDEIARKLRIKKLTVYIQAQNLATITNYKGADPETLQFLAIPVPRTLSVGLNANF